MIEHRSGERAGANPPKPAAPADRSHWAAQWAPLILALPGAAWSFYVALIASAGFFGEPASPADRATSAAALLSGTSLWLVAGLLAAIALRRVAAPVLCGFAALAYAVLPPPGTSPRAPLSSADSAGWLAAWTPPTSWAIALWGAALLVRWTYRRVRA